MKNIFYLLLFLLPSSTFAQMTFAASIGYNYTQILLQFEAVPNATIYELMIWEKEVEGNNLRTLVDSVPLFIVRDLKWGKSYNWQYVAKDKEQHKLFTSKANTFRIKNQSELSPKTYLIEAQNHNNLEGYVFADGAGALFNRKGEMQWMLPSMIQGLPKIGSPILRDLRVSPSGTFTLIVLEKREKGIEISKDGKLLWQTPDDGRVNGDTSEFYHHDFQKLVNGNYMILGSNKKKTALPIKKEEIETYRNTKDIVIEEDSAYSIYPYPTLIEYNANKQVVWSWDSRSFFQELYKKGLKVGTIHANAFEQDDKEEYIYISCRDLGTILKLDKKEKRVVSTYGNPISDKIPNFGKSFFCMQHDISLGKKGIIATFNNDSTSLLNRASSAVLFSQPQNEDEVSIKQVQISCKIDTINNGQVGRSGSVAILENGNILMGMGQLGRVAEYEIGERLSLVWDALLYEVDTLHKKKYPVNSYRNNYTDGMYPLAFYANVLPDKTIKIYNRGEQAQNFEVHIYKKNTKDPIILASPKIGIGQSYHFGHVLVADEKDVFVIPLLDKTNKIKLTF